MEHDLKAIHALVVLAEHGGIRAAARATGISPSALSKRLTRLEQTVGRQLFDRRAGFGLNDSGLTLLPDARRLLAAAERFTDAASVRPEARTIRLGVACGVEDIAARAIAVALRTGCVIDPEDGTSDQLLGRMRDGRLDALVGRIPLDPPPTGITHCALAQDVLGILCPLGHPLVDRSAVHIRELAGERLLGFPLGTSQGLEADIARIWKRAESAWAPQHRASGIDSLLTLVRAGNGLTVVPDRLMQARTAGAIRFIPLADDGARTRLSLGWRNDLPSSDRHALLTWFGLD